MQDPIQEKAAELGRLIGQTPEYQALKRAREQAGQDRELVTRLNRLGELEVELAQAFRSGHAPSESVQQEYETLITEVQASPAYQGLVAGQANLDRVLSRVNDEIARGMETGSQSRIILPS